MRFSYARINWAHLACIWMFSGNRCTWFSEFQDRALVADTWCDLWHWDCAPCWSVSAIPACRETISCKDCSRIALSLDLWLPGTSRFLDHSLLYNSKLHQSMCSRAWWQSATACDWSDLLGSSIPRRSNSKLKRISSLRDLQLIRLWVKVGMIRITARLQCDGIA